MIQRRPRRRSDAAVNLRGSGMKLDIFNHVFPKKYFECMLKVAPNGRDMHKRVRAIPSIVDMDARFRIMDRFGPDYAQVICLGAPPIEVLGPPPVSTDRAKIANDGTAAVGGPPPPQRARQAADYAGDDAAVRPDGETRSADLAAPGARRGHS